MNLVPKISRLYYDTEKHCYDVLVAQTIVKVSLL